MLQLEARVSGNPVVFAGRTLECIVQLRNRSTSRQTLAWASAQVHCQCSFNRARVALTDRSASAAKGSKESPAPDAAAAAFAFTPTKDAKGCCVFESTPLVLLCDLSLDSAEEREYPFTVKLPRNIPPSYRGEAITYTYQLSVGVQRVGERIQLVRVPFRVLPVAEKMEQVCLRGSASFDLPPSPTGHTPPSPGADGLPLAAGRLRTTIRAGSVRSRLGHAAALGFPSGFDDDVAAEGNPFLPEPEIDVLSEERLLLAVMSLTRRRRSSFFNLTTGDGVPFAELTLFKRCFRLGEDVMGHFVLHNNTRRCHNSCEKISEAARRSGTAEEDANALTTHAVEDHACSHGQTAAMALPIPLLATPAFATAEVTVAWQLNFEFTVDAAGASSTWRPQPTAKNTPAGGEGQAEVLLAPLTRQVEVVRWQLPLDVLPADPMHVPFCRAMTVADVVR